MRIPPLSFPNNRRTNGRTRHDSDQLAGEVAVPARTHGGVQPEVRGLQVLHVEQVDAPRGAAERVDPTSRGVVGATANVGEQRGCVGDADVRFQCIACLS